MGCKSRTGLNGSQLCPPPTPADTVSVKAQLKDIFKTLPSKPVCTWYTRLFGCTMPCAVCLYGLLQASRPGISSTASASVCHVCQHSYVILRSSPTCSKATNLTHITKKANCHRLLSRFYFSYCQSDTRNSDVWEKILRFGIHVGMLGECLVAESPMALQLSFTLLAIL